MRTFVQDMVTLFAAIGIGVSIFVWGFVDRNDVTGPLLYGLPALTILAVIIATKMRCQKDLVHDFLYESHGEYFNRHGFCFTIDITKVDGIAYLNVNFQNQRDRRCEGRVSLWLHSDSASRRDLDFRCIEFTIPCGPGAYGVAFQPIAVSRGLAGTIVDYEVGASVVYPEGKGRLLRFRDGISLRSNADFRNDFLMLWKFFGAIAGVFLWYKPAKIRMPYHALDKLPENAPSGVQTFWVMGQEDREHRLVSQNEK